MKNKSKSKPPPKKPAPAKKAARPPKQRETIAQMANGASAAAPRPMIPNGDGTWREYEPLPCNTRVQTSSGRLGKIVGHDADGLPFVALFALVDGALNGELEEPRSIEPMALKVLAPTSRLMAPTSSVNSAEPPPIESSKPAARRASRAKPSTERSVSPALSSTFFCSIDDCEVEYDPGTRAGSRLLNGTNLVGDERVHSRWFCAAHATIADELYKNICTEQVVGAVEWDEHVRVEGARLASKSKAAAPAGGFVRPSSASSCCAPGCTRWYDGEMLFGWFVYVNGKDERRTFCHSHAKLGRAEHDRDKNAHTVGDMAIREYRCSLDGCKEPTIRAATFGLPMAWFAFTPSDGKERVFCSIHADAGREIQREERRSSRVTGGSPTVDDATQRNYESTIATVDKAIARNPLAIPPGGYETPVAPAAPLKAKRTKKTDAVPPSDPPKGVRLFKCAQAGCITTYQSSLSDAAIEAQLDVPDPPRGWWVHEHDVLGRHGASQGNNSAPSDPTVVRAAYCPTHQVIGRERTKAACQRAEELRDQGGATANDFEPELDAMPWDEADPAEQVNGQPDHGSDVEEAMPWE